MTMRRILAAILIVGLSAASALAQSSRQDNLGKFTFATLPSCSATTNVAARAIVTDAAASSCAGTLAGGAGNICAVHCLGAGGWGYMGGLAGSGGATICSGNVALSSGTVTVSNICITGSKALLVSGLNDLNVVYVGSQVAGTATFLSASGQDTSTIYWEQAQ